jgi:GAF domain-containing protein
VVNASHSGRGTWDEGALEYTGLYNARLYADTERRRRWHEVTAEITQLMLGEFDAEQVLQLIADESREVAGAQAAAVLLADGDELVVTAVDGPADFQHYLGNRIPSDLPVLGRVAAGSEQIVLDDLAELLKDTEGLVEFPEGAGPPAHRARDLPEQ